MSFCRFTVFHTGIHMCRCWDFLAVNVHAGRWQVYLSSVRTRIQKLSNKKKKEYWHFKNYNPKQISTSVRAELQWHPNTEYNLIKAINKEVCTVFQHIYRYKEQITHQLSGVHLQGCKSKKKKEEEGQAKMYMMLNRKKGISTKLKLTYSN